jgi:hypothetical protein
MERDMPTLEGVISKLSFVGYHLSIGEDSPEQEQGAGSIIYDIVQDLQEITETYILKARATPEVGGGKGGD